jgi:hypothetical protein
MTTATKSQSDEDDKAKLAYALAGKLPFSEGASMISEMFKVNGLKARSLIDEGRRIAVQAIGRKA